MANDTKTANLCACGCGGLTKSTWMTGHHRRAKGATAPVAAKPIDERIKSSIRVSESGCWVWKLSLDKDGYGSIKINRRTLKAHRVSYEEFVGEIPAGLSVHANCGRRSCVNPAHLEAISHAEVVRRGESDPLKNFSEYYERRRSAEFCPNGHPWDEANTRATEIQRVCRTCLREGARRRRSNPSFAQAERDRERALYELNRDTILERKREGYKQKYLEAKSEGRCVYGGGYRCSSPAIEGKVQCRFHLEESAARSWGIRKHPLKTIYKERGIEVCWICGAGFNDNNRMSNDHLIPRSLGGPDEPWNLAPCCRSCNSRRNNLPLHLTMEVAVHAHLATVDFPEEYLSYLT